MTWNDPINIKKWRESRILLGCAVFHDILKPVAILCKCFQSDELCIVNTIEAIMRTTTSMGKLKTTELKLFPSVKKVLDRMQEEEGTADTYSYQGAEIVQHSRSRALTFLEGNYCAYIDLVLTCLRDRLKVEDVSNIDTLTHALKILATHGWEKTTDASFGYEAIQHTQLRFATPLQEANVNTALLQQEWDDLVLYAKQYINLVDPYKVVWWKLFNSPDSNKWENILTLVELTFTIPLSNGRVERCFSQLKLTKSEKRTSLQEDRLDNLLRIRIEGPSLEHWDASTAMKLWWEDKTRRVSSDHLGPRKRKRPDNDHASGEDEDFTWSLSDWEDWLRSDNSDSD